ncbi:hypothetical protein [Kaarinaea lacus]
MSDRLNTAYLNDFVALPAHLYPGRNLVCHTLLSRKMPNDQQDMEITSLAQQHIVATRSG